MSPFNGDARRGLAVVRDQRAVGMSSEQEIDHFGVPTACRAVQRSESPLLARVHVCSPFQKQGRRLPVAHGDGGMERRDALSVLRVGVNVGAAFDQGPGELRMAEEDCQSKRGKPVSRERVEQ